MTTYTQGEHAQTEALRPKFGDLLRNTMASESNPRRDAYFIREVHRSGGGVNPGRWFEMTDGKGETWLSNPQNLVPAATAQPAAPQGVAYAEPTYLCQAWGETDLPSAAIVRGLDAVRAFLVDQWLGDADQEHDDGTKALPAAMAHMQEEWAQEGEAWKWSVDFEIGGVSVQRVDDVGASHGQAPAGAADQDGEAFRTAARLGLTLRFYGGCAQSSMPNTPSAYEVVAGGDRSAAMREAVQRAAAVIENGGESQRLDATAQAAPAADHDTLRCAVGNCTFNGEVERHANGCPSAPQAAPAAGAVAGRITEVMLDAATNALVLMEEGTDTSALATGEADYMRSIARATVEAAIAAAPTPAAQAGSVQDLQSVHDAVTIELLNERVAYLEGRLKEADSVREDAAPQPAIENPYRAMTGRHEAFEQGVLKTLAAFRAKHAARKQGGV